MPSSELKQAKSEIAKAIKAYAANEDDYTDDAKNLWTLPNNTKKEDLASRIHFKLSLAQKQLSDIESDLRDLDKKNAKSGNPSRSITKFINEQESWRSEAAHSVKTLKEGMEVAMEMYAE